MCAYNRLKKLLPAPLKKGIKKVLIKLLESDELGNIFNESASVAYSQEGEDRILYSLFSLLNKKNGFYVDVGAHHPQRFSNTYIFYLQGWRGINIDANADVFPLFQKERPRDINISMGVGIKAETSIFYVFNDPAVNTFDVKTAQNCIKETSFKIIDERNVEIMPLSHILERYLPKNQRIDFLSVDVEGRDLDVLKSNDWSKYLPFCILVEYYGGFVRKEGFFFDEVLNSEVSQYLRSKGYRVFAKTLNTIFFIHTSNSKVLDQPKTGII